jgi:hypothetical protein
MNKILKIVINLVIVCSTASSGAALMYSAYEELDGLSQNVVSASMSKFVTYIVAGLFSHGICLIFGYHLLLACSCNIRTHEIDALWILSIVELGCLFLTLVTSVGLTHDLLCTTPNVTTRHVVLTISKIILLALAFVLGATGLAQFMDTDKITLHHKLLCGIGIALGLLVGMWFAVHNTIEYRSKYSLGIFGFWGLYAVVILLFFLFFGLGPLSLGRLPGILSSIISSIVANTLFALLLLFDPNYLVPVINIPSLSDSACEAEIARVDVLSMFFVSVAAKLIIGALCVVSIAITVCVVSKMGQKDKKAPENQNAQENSVLSLSEQPLTV